MREHRRRRDGARERHLPGDRLEEHAAERVDVHARVDLLAQQLLGRGVVARAEEAADLRSAAPSTALTFFISPKSVRMQCSSSPSPSIRTLAGLTSRWTIPRACAASSASATCAISRAASGGASLRPPASSAARSEPVDVLHRHEQPPVLRARAVDAHDVRMADRDLRLVLALEADPELAILAELRRDHLQRDVAVELEMAGLEDHAHRAAARDAEDQVIRERRADGELFHALVRSYHFRGSACNGRPMSSRAAPSSEGHERYDQRHDDRRGDVRGGGGAPPARAARALLPDARLVRGGRGRAAGGVPARVARRARRSTGDAQLRAWLYKIATNVCLDALRRNKRQVPVLHSKAEVPWLQPYPDRLLDEIAPTERAAGRRRRRARDDRADLHRADPAAAARASARS